MTNLKKSLPILIVLFAMILGAWSLPYSSAMAATPTKSPTKAPTSGGGTSSRPVLQGSLASLPGVQAKIDELSRFKPAMTAMSRRAGASKFDRQYVNDSLAMNTEELAVMQYALTRVTNTDLRDLINLMVTQHTDDMRNLMTLQSRLNGKSSADVTKVSVNSRTPDYVLGIRTENLNTKYLARLQAYSGSNFDQAALDVLMELHGADIEDEIASQFQLRNSAFVAFDRHSMAVTELHIKLMDALNDQLFVHITPDFDFTPQQGGGGGVSPTAQPSVVPSSMPTP